MYKFFITVGAVILLAGCSSTLGCPTGQTAVSMGPEGTLVYTKVMGACQAPISSGGSLSSGPMPPPPPGVKGWMDLFR